MHWDDLRNVYGVDEYGFALNTWDNVGLQYGPGSLQSGEISKADFLDVNEQIGGWKQPHGFGPPIFPYDEGNINFGEPGNSNRATGNVTDINRAYQSGQVFRGYSDAPIIDLRQYQDPVLDLHHFLQSFAARDRMMQVRGHADNQLIWVDGTQRVSNVFLDMRHDVLYMALATLDEWLANMRANPGLTAAETRPAQAMDRCWNDEGDVYPTEGPNALTDEDSERLKTIFPAGVCDDVQGNVGYPAGWF